MLQDRVNGNDEVSHNNLMRLWSVLIPEEITISSFGTEGTVYQSRSTTLSNSHQPNIT